MPSNIFALSNIKKLMRLQQTRLSSIEKLFIQAQQEYKQACKVLKERQNNIRIVNNKISNLYSYMVLDEVCSSPEKLNRGDAYLFWLKYDLEMHEYYYSQEQESVEEANERYMSTKREWYKQKLKNEKLNELFIQHINAERNHKEEIEGESIYEIQSMNGIMAHG